MNAPLPNGDETASTQLEKLRLEIELLQREKKVFWLKLPVLTTFVAAAGLVLTVWQFRTTELARIAERTASIENETRERTAKIQKANAAQDRSIHI